MRFRVNEISGYEGVKDYYYFDIREIRIISVKGVTEKILKMNKNYVSMMTEKGGKITVHIESIKEAYIKDITLEDSVSLEELLEQKRELEEKIERAKEQQYENNKMKHLLESGKFRDFSRILYEVLILSEQLDRWVSVSELEIPSVEKCEYCDFDDIDYCKLSPICAKRFRGREWTDWSSECIAKLLK